MYTRTIRGVLAGLVCLLVIGGVGACKQGPEDSTLTASVKSKLAADTRTSATAVNVTTNEGVVTLTGTVNSAAEKTQAETIAKGVEGVKSVTNNLTVQAPVATAPAASNNDAAIKSAVEANLTKASITGVTVRVADGVVYLTGKVPAASFQKAVQAANEAKPTPTRVQNDLQRA